MNQDVEQIVRVVTKEAWSRKWLVMFLYFFTSMLFAGAAWVWPQIFTSTATIVAEERNIIRPIMQGTAETTAVAEPSRMAIQILNSRSTLTEIFAKGGWLDEDATPEEIDNMMENVRSSTEVTSMGRNIFQISFKDRNAKKAYLTAKEFSEIFVRESQELKKRESRAAFEFIEQKVKDYREKIKIKEEKIKQFRAENVDSTPGAEQASNERILSLNRQVDDIDVQIGEERTRLESQNNQLQGGGGAENSASIARETTLRERVNALKTQLEDLRLVYKDTYPDIVQILAQIKSTEKEIEMVIMERNEPDSIRQNKERDAEFTREINSQILATQTNISTLTSRKNQLLLLLDKETDKVARIKESEAELNELNSELQLEVQQRDELRAQRETARITMEMDEANQGIVMRIQEKAFIPANPKGVRFLHLILAGLFMSFMVPLGVVFGLALIDQKVRDARTIDGDLEIPVLASVYPVRTSAEKRKLQINIAIIALIILTSWSIYGYEIWLRVQG